MTDTSLIRFNAGDSDALVFEKLNDLSEQVTGLLDAPAGGGGGTFSGARVELSADLTGVNYSASTTITWATEVEDVGGWWAAGAPTIFTVPAGVTHIEAGGHVGGQVLSGDYALWVDVDTGGGFLDDLNYGYASHNRGSSGNFAVNVFTGPISVSAGDTVRMRFVSTDTSINILAARSAFWIRAVP